MLWVLLCLIAFFNFSLWKHFFLWLSTGILSACTCMWSHAYRSHMHTGPICTPERVFRPIDRPIYTGKRKISREIAKQMNDRGSHNENALTVSNTIYWCYKWWNTWDNGPTNWNFIIFCESSSCSWIFHCRECPDYLSFPILHFLRFSNFSIWIIGHSTSQPNLLSK